MRLLAYHRVSTEEQAKGGHSIRLADADFLVWCKREGHELVAVLHDEGISASVPLAKRKGGAELLARLEAGEADGVLCTFADRLFRIGLDAATWGTWFRARGMALLGTQEAIDILDDDGWLLFWVKAGLAERERNKIVLRARQTSQGLKAGAQAYGHIPFGLVSLDGKLFRDPATWPVREEILKLKRRGLSWRAVARELETDCVASPTGARIWHISTLRNIAQSHHGLKHIPPLPKKDEARVSGGAA